MQITILNGKERRPVQVQATLLDIPGFPNLAVHRTYFGNPYQMPRQPQKYYTVTETTTGLAVYTSNAPQSKAYAIAKATAMLETVGIEKFREIVERERGKNCLVTRQNLR